MTASKRRTPLLAAGLTLLPLLPVGSSSGGCLQPPGLAQPFAALGVPAVKGFPELISWEKMQPAGFTELVLTLKSRSRWASKDYLTNYRPKDEYLDLYEAWVGAVVERYDADGLEDMPGLKWPVRSP